MAAAPEPEKKTETAKDLEKFVVLEDDKEENDAVASSYWFINQPQITREDGTEWPWKCFMPWDTYQADVSIDIGKHHDPKIFMDKFAHATVKFLKFLSFMCFRQNLVYHAMLLETVAAIPGMVAGMMLQFRSLRRFQPSGGWNKAMLEEAENERMHLMTLLEIAKPNWYARVMVLLVQAFFFSQFLIFYTLSPKLAHRIVGYMEEEAIISYTHYLKEIECGKIENIPAPAIAIDYWRLPEHATLKDVIVSIRSDEAHHRDVNHFASDIHHVGKDLKEVAAPLGYH